MKTLCFSLPELAAIAGVNQLTAKRRVARAGVEADILAVCGSDRPPLQLFGEGRLAEVLRAINPTPEIIA